MTKEAMPDHSRYGFQKATEDVWDQTSSGSIARPCLSNVSYTTCQICPPNGEMASCSELCLVPRAQSAAVGPAMPGIRARDPALRIEARGGCALWGG